MCKPIFLMAALLISLTAAPSFADQIRLFVSGIETVGVQNKDEMKAIVQTLLASRLNGAGISAVENLAEADVVVNGTYISTGKLFSVDAVAKTTAGKTLTRAFVQGEKPDDLIPSVGILAEKLSAELVKVYARDKSAAPVQGAVVTPAIEIPHKTNVVTAPVSDFIKPQAEAPRSSSDWISPRLTGAANLLALGTTLPDGSREIFLAEAHRLAYYRQSAVMKLVAEAELSPAGKIISLDTLQGSDGSVDIYVTIIRRNEPASQVWQVKGDKLVLVADKLPYFFRTANLSGGPKKLFVQTMGRNEDFYGTVAEATRSGSSITLKNTFAMPRYGTIYSFNQFRDRDGKTFTTVINPDGYLIVYDLQLKELWRSNDKFGGSELYFQKEDDLNLRLTGELTRWIFMNQRMQVSSKGEIVVGKNDGFWVLGNSRSYKRGAVYCLAWNGSSLEEKWRTRDTQNYMPDFIFDEVSNELLMLQTVQRPGMSERGASSLTIKKVE
jgi:hypothetical protein